MTAAVLWCVALAAVLAVMFGLYEYRQGDVKMDSSLSILYAMLNRNVYALFLSWFVIACVTNNAGKYILYFRLLASYRLKKKHIFMILTIVGL